MTVFGGAVLSVYERHDGARGFIVTGHPVTGNPDRSSETTGRRPALYRRSGQPPGGRYIVSFTAAASTSAGVRSATVRSVTPPPTLTASAAAAAETLSGKSAMAYAFVSPKAKLSTHPVPRSTRLSRPWPSSSQHMPAREMNSARLVESKRRSWPDERCASRCFSLDARSVGSCQPLP